MTPRLLSSLSNYARIGVKKWRDAGELINSQGIYKDPKASRSRSTTDSAPPITSLDINPLLRSMIFAVKSITIHSSCS